MTSTSTSRISFATPFASGFLSLEETSCGERVVMPTPEHLKQRARFVTEAEIIDAIDDTATRIKNLRLTAENLDHKAKRLFMKLDGVKIADLEKRQQADDWVESAERKRCKALKLERGHMTHLKNKLSEFRTMLLPNIGVTDQSITK